MRWKKSLPANNPVYRVLHGIGTFSLECVVAKVPIATHLSFFCESQVRNFYKLKINVFFFTKRSQKGFLLVDI